MSAQLRGVASGAESLDKKGQFPVIEEDEDKQDLLFVDEEKHEKPSVHQLRVEVSKLPIILPKSRENVYFQRSFIKAKTPDGETEKPGKSKWIISLSGTP